jgi:hypothetical protein
MGKKRHSGRYGSGGERGMKTDAQRYTENAKNLLLVTFTKQDLINELVKREGVKVFGPYDKTTAYKIEGKGPAIFLKVDKE